MEEVYNRLIFLKDKAPALLEGGGVGDVREVLKCRLWVDKNMSPNADGYAWWLLVRGDVNCAPKRESLQVLSLAESVELGAVCPLSWYSVVWQNFQEGKCGIYG
jgi:hypothetical protein